MFVLYESPAGYQLFKLRDKSKLDDLESLYKEFQTLEDAQKIVKLKAFEKFSDTTAALSAATSLVDGKLDKGLKKFLKANLKEGAKLGVQDSKLGSIIKEKLGLKVVLDDSVIELTRGIRSQLNGLCGGGISEADHNAMKLGLSHSLCRYTLKFSPEKVDVMIIQSIALLDELDKELNTYAMRVREWYGWHFPEVSKLVADHMVYCKMIKLMGFRTNAKNCDFSEVMPEEVEDAVKEAAEVSMGTEISDEDRLNIEMLCDQVISLGEYRASLFEYLKNRMQAIAPNLSVVVGELVGARLIAHSGSLINLAKHPASTVQILGAEKALFRALKTKHATPKYGLIYHASLVGQAGPKHKGKMARVVAAKTALSARMDALGEQDEATLGYEVRDQIERRLVELEGGKISSLSGSGKGKNKEKYQKPTSTPSYNAAADDVVDEDDEADKKKKKKKKKSKKSSSEEEQEMEVEEEEEAPVEKKKKKKKRKAEAIEEDEEEEAAPADKKKKKKKKKSKSE